MSNLINLTSRLAKLSQQHVTATHVESEAKERFKVVCDELDLSIHDEAVKTVDDEDFQKLYNEWQDAIDVVDDLSNEIADVEEEIEELSNLREDDSVDW